MTLEQRLFEHFEKLNRPENPLVVFDVDSTLMNTEPRNRAILEESAESFPFVREYLNRLDDEELGWNFLAPLQKAGLTDKKKLRSIRRYWEERFFTDEYVQKDEAYPGAGELLRLLKEKGFVLAYLTGRHINGMSEGTKISFRQAGFPACDEEHFLFKPRFDMDDAIFKKSACEKIASLGTVVATFDNEPANCNLLVNAFPEALHFWLNTITSPEPEQLDERIIHIKGFEV